MKETRFYPTIWQTIPFSFDMINQWDAEGRRIKELILKNSYAYCSKTRVQIKNLG